MGRDLIHEHKYKQYLKNIKKQIMNTVQKLDYLEKKLEASGCPKELSPSYALQIIRDCDKNNKSVLDVELIDSKLKQ